MRCYDPFTMARYIEKRKTGVWARFARQYQIHLFVWMGLAFLFVFSYAPMFGILMAFQNYDISTGFKGIFSGPWVGFKYFIEFFTDPMFEAILVNTLSLSLLKLLFSFPFPIIFAIMITETRNMAVRRCVQTVSYLPHFISWVIVSGLVFTFFSVDYGVINKIFVFFGKDPLPFITSPAYYWFLAVFTDIWKDMGWWAIIFIAAITTIDPALFEAAIIDGAGRIARIRYIILPGLGGAVTVTLILSMGSLLGGGLSGSNFEQSMLIGNKLNAVRSEIIQSYSLRMGLGMGRFSFGTAVGLLQSITSVILVFGSNAFFKKIRGFGLF